MKNVLPKDYYVYVAVSTAYIGSFIMGTSISWTSPVIIKLSTLTDNPLGRTITSSEKGLLGSISVIGALFGSLLTGIIAKKFGRKPTFIIIAIPLAISYIILLFSKTIFWMYIGRIIGGITAGGVPAITPIYFGEVAEVKNRGMLGAGLNLFINSGFLFALTVGIYTSYAWFHIILTICPIVYIILILILLPESPHYLIEKNMQKAENSLKKLRGRDDVSNELLQIKEFVEQKVEKSLKDVFNNKGLRRGLIMGAGLLIFQQCTGVSAIMNFCQMIFNEVPDFISSDLSTIIVASMQLAFAFITPAITDKTGRKILLILSYIGISITLFIFGTYFYMKQNDYNVSSINWLPLLSLILFKFNYAVGAGCIPWIILGEIFPLEVKAAATSFLGIIWSLISFLMIICFNWCVDWIGMGQTFWIFAAFSVFGTFFMIFGVMETKGKTLMKIQEEIHS